MMDNRARPTSIQYLDATAPPAAAGLLGLWTTAPAPSRAVEFAAPAVPDEAVSLWRVTLPPDASQAAAHLAEAEAILEGSRQALAGSLGRLQAFARGGVSFGLPETSARAGRPEAVLSGLLRGVPASEGVSFGVGERLVENWDEVGQQFRRFTGQLTRAVSQQAWVDTSAGGRRLGWTVVGWTGDLRTCWPAGVDDEQANLHRRALVLALASRLALIRTLGLAARGAAVLAVAATNPLGPLLALPAAWRFIDEVITEYHARGGAA